MQVYSNELYHYGVVGMKWGVRRYQNPDGSLKPAGQKRYDRLNARFEKERENSRNQAAKLTERRASVRVKKASKYDKKIAKYQEHINSYKPIKNGLKDHKGRDIMTKDDVASQVKALRDAQNKIKEKKRASLSDYDAGTKMIKAGMKKHEQVIKNYQNVKLKSIKGQIDKKGPEYKSAMKEYVTQVLRDANNYGDFSASVLNYAARSDAAQEYREKMKSGK